MYFILVQCSISGGAMVVGGLGEYDWLNSSEGLGIWSPPDAPAVRFNFPLVVVDSRVFMCGGRSLKYEDIADCHVLDIHDSPPSWKVAQPLPEAVDGHTGVAIGSHIWFVQWSYLYDYYTTTGATRRFRLPFSINYGHCSVGNNTHSYLIGMGSDYTEIWVNIIASDSTWWKLVARLPTSMRYLSCLWFEDEIYILGGEGDSEYRRSTYAMNPQTHSLRALADLNHGRAHARAMVLNCKPALVGGKTRGTRFSVTLDDIEVYDKVSNSWSVYHLSLQTARYQFGLAQLPN